MRNPSCQFISALILVAGGLASTAKAQTPATPAPAPAPRQITLAAGTPVRLVLLDELTSGGSQKGMEVRLVVVESLQGLPPMSQATAVVSWSRTEGTLGRLTNQPARLSLTLKSLKGPHGEEIPLSADPKEPKDYELTRANTGRPEMAQKAPEAADDITANAVKELIEKGQTGGLKPDEVAQLARKLGMAETTKLAEAGQLDTVSNLFQKLRTGGTLVGLATGATVGAAMEFVNLAGDLGYRVGRTLGGRNIRAYPGTVIPAFVAKDTTVTLAP